MIGHIIGFWLKATAIAVWATLKGIGISTKWLLRIPRSILGIEERLLGFCVCALILGCAFAYSKFGLNFGKEHLRWHLWVGNTIGSYQAYISEYPRGRYVGAAQSRIRQLQDDKTVAEAALGTGTIAALDRFLRDYPGHQQYEEVRAARKGRGIGDLNSGRAIEFEAAGLDGAGDIQRIVLRVRRLAQRDVIVRIPPGTLFVSNSPSIQNMVVVADTKLDLTTREWERIVVPVLSASVRKAVPKYWHTFGIVRSDPQSELARVADGLSVEGVSFGVKQAAIWIAADDARYDDLRAWQVLSGVTWSYPAIGSYETAMAMRICERVGVNLAGKAILNDRDRILADLRSQPHPRDLATWLEQIR